MLNKNAKIILIKKGSNEQKEMHICEFQKEFCFEIKRALDSFKNDEKIKN